MSDTHSFHSHHGVSAVVEIANLGAEKVESGLNVAKAIAASEAFRKFNWLKNAPIRNVAGNFRGMVVSKRWAVVFHFAEDALKPVEKVATFAAIAENILKAHSQIEPILKSKDSWDIKAARVSTQVSSIALRAAGGAIPAGAHILALSLSGYCQLAALSGVHSANGLSHRLQALDASINSNFNKITDGENIRLFINSHLALR